MTWAELEMLAICGMFGWFPCLKIMFFTNKIWKMWCHCSHPGFQFHRSPRADWRPFCDRYLYEPSFPNVSERDVVVASAFTRWVDVPWGLGDLGTTPYPPWIPWIPMDSDQPATFSVWDWGCPARWLGQVMISYKNMPKLPKSMGFPRQWSTMIYFIYFPDGFSRSFCQFTEG